MKGGAPLIALHPTRGGSRATNNRNSSGSDELGETISSLYTQADETGETISSLYTQSGETGETISSLYTEIG
jgi:hypothetical protein